MTKHRSLVYGAALPQDFLDALQELLGTYVSPNMAVTVLNGTTVQVAAGTDNAQISLAINGKWRYVTSAVNATHPGGTAGIYALWATASDNAFAVGPPEVDSTNYAFALLINSGATPGTALSRQIGYVEWNGTAITGARLILDDPATRGTLEPGDYILSAGATRAGALLCDGTSYLRTAYPALFNALGGASSPYGLPDGTHFNVPDFRGRTLIGAGTGAGLTARAIGTIGGAETITLSAAESGVPVHTHPGGTTGAGSAHSHTGVTDTAGAHSHVPSLPSSAFISNGGGLGANVSTGGGGYAFDNSTSVAGNHAHNLSINNENSHTHATPTVAANSAAAAASAHANMQPWLAGYVYIKT